MKNNTLKSCLSIALCLCMLLGLLPVTTAFAQDSVMIVNAEDATTETAKLLSQQIDLLSGGSNRNGRVRLSGFSQSADGSTDMKELKGKHYLIRVQDNVFYALDGSWTESDANLPLKKVTPSDITSFYSITSDITTAMAFEFHYAGLASNGMPGYVLRFNNGKNLAVGSQYTGTYKNLYYVKADATADLSKAPSIRFEHPDGSGWARIRNFDGTHGLRQSSDMSCVRWKDNSNADNDYNGNALYLYRLWSTVELGSAIRSMQSYLEMPELYDQTVYSQFLTCLTQSILLFQQYDSEPTALIEPYNFVQDTLDEQAAALRAFADQLTPSENLTAEQTALLLRRELDTLPTTGTERNGRVKLSGFTQSADGSTDMKELKGKHYLIRVQSNAFYALDGSWTGTDANLPLKSVTPSNTTSFYYISDGISPNMAFDFYYTGTASNGMPGYVLRFNNGKNLGVGSQYTGTYKNLYYVKADSNTDLSKAPKIRFEHPDGSGWARIRNLDGTHGLRQSSDMSCVRWKDNSSGDNDYDGNALYLYRLWSTNGLISAIHDMKSYLDTPGFYDEAVYSEFLSCMRESIDLFQQYNANPTAMIAPYDFIQNTLDQKEAELRSFVSRLAFEFETPSADELNAVTTIHQLPSKQPRAEGDYEHGMSYIIQTRKGKIIVIDGGWEKENADGKYLFSYLQKITGDATPHIDAWFITHAHGDHHGAVSTIANLYADQITVDAFYHHYPTYEQIEEYLPDTGIDSSKAAVDRVPKQMKKLKNAEGGPVKEVFCNSKHSGKCNSTFDFDEVHIDILLDFEDVIWAADNVSGTYSGTSENEGRVFSNKTFKQLLSGNFNETSLVMRVSVGGKNILFTGDINYVGGYMLNKYHDANSKNPDSYYSLKSDYVQVSHHGYYGLPKNVYQKVDADVALWPTPSYEYNATTSTNKNLVCTRQWFTDMGATSYASYMGPQVFEFPVVRSDAAISIPAELKDYVFNAEYYSAKYPELAELYGNNERDLYYHFVQYGIEEGRSASPFFDVAFYATQNGQQLLDTLKGNYVAAFEDFLSKYRTQSMMKLSQTFDASVYAAAHAELKEQGYTTLFALLKHYAENAYATGETASTIYYDSSTASYHNNCTVLSASSATCTQAGLTEGVECQSCNETVIEQQQIPALGHTEVIDKSVAPTCAETGLTEGKHCATCGEVLVAQTTVDALGHTEVIDEAVTPTCTETGLTQGSHCVTCGEVLVAQTTVDALGHTEVIDEAVAPTCTETGLTQGSHCATCGKVLVARGILDALGHAPVYADNGDKTHTVTCENCDYSEIVDCEFENSTCVCGATEIAEPIYDDAVKFSHSLTLENDISINFIGLGSALSVYDSFYLECKVPVYSGNELTGYEIVNIEPVYNGKNYEFTLLGVTAKMMNDDIEAVLRMTKGGQEYYSKTDVYSVAEYAYGKLDSTKATDTDELKAICANLLRYGALAQTQFNYRTDALVDAAMTDAHKAYLTDLATVEMKDYRKQLNDLDTVIVPWKSTTLELGNKVIMCLIANLANYTGDPSGLTMRLTYVDSNGLTVTEERPLELYNPDALTYAVSYDGLRATEMRSIVSAAIYNGDTRVSKTVEYSIESYGARSSDAAMQTLCLAMLAYGDAANAFFSK